MNNPSLLKDNSYRNLLNKGSITKLIICSLILFLNTVGAQAGDVTLCSDSIGGYCFGVYPGSGKKIADNLYRFKTSYSNMSIDVNCSSLLFRVAVSKTKKTIDSNGNVVNSNDVIETSNFETSASSVQKKNLKSICSKKKQ